MTKPGWFDYRVTVGNVMAVLTTIVGLIWMLAEMRQTEALANHRITQVESQMKARDSDHDLLLEMRGDLKALREALARFERNDTRRRDP